MYAVETANLSSQSHILCTVCCYNFQPVSKKGLVVISTSCHVFFIKIATICLFYICHIRTALHHLPTCWNNNNDRATIFPVSISTLCLFYLQKFTFWFLTFVKSVQLIPICPPVMTTQMTEQVYIHLWFLPYVMYYTF